MVPYCSAAAWNEAICGLFPAVDIVDQAAEGFVGALMTSVAGAARLSSIRSVRQQVHRRSSHIRRAEAAVVQINFQLSGQCAVRQDGREAVIGPGEFAIYESPREYALGFTGPFSQLSLMLPHGLIKQRFGALEAFTARRFDGRTGAGRFLFAFVEQMAQHNSADGALGERLQDHLVDLLITTLSPAASSVQPAGKAQMLARIKTFALARLRDPELGPAMLARAHGLSLRSLYDLFASEGETPLRWIQNARLDACRRDLEAPALKSQPINLIACTWGFGNAAHFSRLFRSRFDHTPRQLRQASGRA